MRWEVMAQVPIRCNDRACMPEEKRSPQKKVSLFKKLVCASADFSAAREATELLIANYENWEHGEAIRAIATGIIIAYARPFGRNDGLGPLPKTYRTIDHVDAQIVHNRVLDARDVLEAHNDILKRGRLIASRDVGNDPLNIQIEIRGDGSAFWDVAIPSLRLPEFRRLLRMLCIQETRVREDANSVLSDLLKKNPRSDGRYTLEKNFP
jgi:hypothetical protein